MNINRRLKISAFVTFSKFSLDADLFLYQARFLMELVL